MYDCPAVKRVAVSAIFAIAALVVALSPAANAQLVLDPEHTITVAKGDTIFLDTPLINRSADKLYIEGAGRVELSAASPRFWGDLFVRGAEFRLHKEGSFTEGDGQFVTIANGGALIIDKPTQSEEPLGWRRLTLSGGTLRVLAPEDPLKEVVEAYIDEARGANTIDIQLLKRTRSYRVFSRLSSFGTLNLTGDRPYSSDGRDNTIQFIYGDHTAPSIKEIVPYVTIHGSDFAAPIKYSGFTSYALVANPIYTTGRDPTLWEKTDNVFISGGGLVLEKYTVDWGVNSLKFAGDGLPLTFNDNWMTIESGGILIVGDQARINGRGLIRSKTPPIGISRIFLHTYADLHIEEEVYLVGNMGLTKTGPHALVLNNDEAGYHSLRGDLSIFEGILRILGGRLYITALIKLGDGAGTDVLELGNNLNNPLQNTYTHRPLDIELHGNPFKPTTDAAVLQIGSNTQQHFWNFYVTNQGTIDFKGSTQAKPSILYLDHLFIEGGQLIVQNWVDQQTYLLVERSWGDANVPPLLNKIYFAGHGPAALWRTHGLKGFDDYWQITPLGGAVPEPTTYGAIIGAVGLGLVAWRKKHRK